MERLSAVTKYQGLEIIVCKGRGWRGGGYRDFKFVLNQKVIQNLTLIIYKKYYRVIYLRFECKLEYDISY